MSVPPLVWFGNPAPAVVLVRCNADGTVLTDPDGREVRERVPHHLPDGIRWTVVPFMVETVAEFVVLMFSPGGVWQAHSDAPRPSWVYSDDGALTAELSATLDLPINVDFTPPAG